MSHFWGNVFEINAIVPTTDEDSIFAIAKFFKFQILETFSSILEKFWVLISILIPFKLKNLEKEETDDDNDDDGGGYRNSDDNMTAKMDEIILSVFETF